MLGFFKFLYDKNFRVPVLLTNDTEHRVASTLELFMDLAYVAALAAVAEAAPATAEAAPTAAEAAFWVVAAAALAAGCPGQPPGSPG